MTKEQWQKVKYFRPDSPYDKWGNPYKMDFILIMALDEFREDVGKPVNVHEAYALKGHARNSLHKDGKAVDIFVEKIDLLELFLKAEKRLAFTGIGVYDWGLHLDVRTILDVGARWCRIDGIYLPLTALNMDFLRRQYKFKEVNNNEE